MNKIFFKIFIICILIVGSKNNFYSQNPAACANTQNLCTNSLFSFSASAGTGLTPGLNVSNPFGNPQAVNAGCMFTNVANPQWLMLNITSSGNLGFSFGAFGSAFPQAGNYDWIMWLYSPTACNDIFSNTLPPVACNWNCTGSGGTGMGTVPAGGSFCNFQPSIPVVQGQQYIILITNPSGVNTPVSFANTGSAGVSCNPLLFPNLTACPGQLAVFTGTWVNASSGTYTLYPGAVVQTNPSFTVSSLVNQVYTVQAQGLNTSAAAIADQTTFTLTINPVIPISVTTPTNFCYGSNANFTINPTGSGSFSVAGPASPTSTFATTSISIPNITTPNIGTFSITASYTNGCTGAQTTQVNVAPNHSITVSTSSNACQGGTVNLTSSMPTATAYAWAGPGAYASGLQNPTINTIQPASSGIYTVSSNINFNGIACPITNTMQIDVVATNTVAITQNFTLCEGSNLNLTSSAGGAVSYSWAGPGTYTSGLQNPTRTSISPTEAGNYFVTALFTNGSITCTTGAVSNVSVVATSPVTVTVPNNICQNVTANMTASATGALGYTWAGPNTFTSNIASPSIVNIQPVGSGVYTATATFAIGTVSCTTTGTNQISVVVTNPVTVTPTFTLCEGANLNLLSSATSAVSYSWNGPGVFTSALQNPTVVAIQPSSSGNYTATAFFTNGFLTCNTSAVSNVSVVATPTITVTYPANICQNTTLNLSAAAPGALSYAWAGPNGFISNIAAPNIPNIQTVGAGVYSTTALFSIGTLTCSNTSTNQINVVGTSTITVTPTFTLCEGANLNLLANAASAISYSWSGPAAYTSPIQNATIISILPTGAGNYTATALFANGSLTCATTGVSNVSVVATPAVNVLLPNNICQNATATLSTNAPGAVSYSWNGPNSFSSNLASTSIVNIQQNGAGVYTSTAVFAIGSVSCTNTGTNQIAVVAINSITVNSIMNGCALQTNVLQANSLGAVSYFWNGPSSYTAAVANATIYNTPVTAAGIYTITTQYTNGFLTCTNSNTLNLIVNPVISFTLPASQFACYNSMLTIPGPAGASSYTWQNASGVISNAQNLNISNINLTHAGTYSLTASIGFCATTETVQLDVSTPIQYTLVPTNTTICRGDSVKLKVGSHGGSANYAYTWNPESFLSSPTGSLQTSTPFGTVIYNIYAYDIACPTYTIAYTFTINVKQPPLPDLRMENAIGCEPFCAFYNAKIGTDALSVTYDFGNGVSPLEADSFYYCLPDAGTYTLNILTKGTNGCSGKFQYLDPIVVNPSPKADFTYIPELPTISGNQVVFFPSAQNGPIVSQTWMFNRPGQTGYDSTSTAYPIRYYSEVGKYPVMLISITDLGCADTVFKVLEVVDDFAVYIPNSFTPNGDGKNDLFIAQGIGFSKDDFIMELFAHNGNQVYFSRDYSKGWDGTIKGKDAEVATYIYKIKVLGVHGEGYKEYIGYVNLIR
jgi:gliding motility-associated-like protein